MVQVHPTYTQSATEWLKLVLSTNVGNGRLWSSSYIIVTMSLSITPVKSTQVNISYFSCSPLSITQLQW